MRSGDERMSEGKVRVVVRSKKVPAAVVPVVAREISFTGTWYPGRLGRSVVYGSRLDEEHQRAIEDGRRMADQLGLKLEIVDLSRVNALRRALAAIGSRFDQSPRLMVTQSYAPAPVGACAERPGTPR
jgi:hypothetical protein